MTDDPDPCCPACHDTGALLHSVECPRMRRHLEELHGAADRHAREFLNDPMLREAP